MRILGLDYGSKTVGVAVTDALGLTAQPLETIKRREENILRKTFRRIEELVKEYEVTEIVVGLPLNMNGTESERSLAARQFGALLSRRTGLPVYFEDERLTTAEAEEILLSGGIRKDEMKTYVDKIAASLILRSYMERKESDD